MFLKNLIFKLIIIPVFEKYLWLKKKFTSKTDNTREKIILTFTNRYIIHLIALAIAFGVSASNILAYENAENYGQNALIYDIINVENFDVIEEKVITLNENKIASYLGESFQLESELFTEAQKKEEEIYQEQYESDLATTQGGTTLIKPELASTEAAKVTRTSIKEYAVAEGDSIGSIANQFNISIDTVLWANNLSSWSIIRPGQKLIIPPTSGVVHTIKKGDTISKIAQKYSASESSIKNFNNNIDDSLLVVGETLMVPGGRIIYTERPRSYATTVSTPVYTTPEVPTSGKMYWPSSCRRITQYYRGWLHTGIDIACGLSQPIRASEAGTVSQIQYLRYGYGYNLIINHTDGKQTLYAHLSQIYVTVGQKVDKAQVIALEGSTGRSTGAHLHFEVRINGQRLNPLNYVR